MTQDMRRDRSLPQLGMPLRSRFNRQGQTLCHRRARQRTLGAVREKYRMGIRRDLPQPGSQARASRLPSLRARSIRRAISAWRKYAAAVVDVIARKDAVVGPLWLGHTTDRTWQSHEALNASCSRSAAVGLERTEPTPMQAPTYLPGMTPTVRVASKGCKLAAGDGHPEAVATAFCQICRHAIGHPRRRDHGRLPGHGRATAASAGQSTLA